MMQADFNPFLPLVSISSIQAYLDSSSFTSTKSAEETLDVHAKLRDLGICKNESMRKSIHLIQSLS